MQSFALAGQLIMVYKHAQGLLNCAKYLRNKRKGAWHLNMMLYHCLDEPHGELIPSDFYTKAIAKITKLGHILKDVDMIDGKLVNINDNSIIDDDRIEQKMCTFKSLAITCLGSPLALQSLKENMVAFSAFTGHAPFECYREPLIVNSLTKVFNFLNISSQQRKEVRSTICRQVTQHNIWMGANLEILNGLKVELDSLSHKAPSCEIEMGKQIVSCCLQLLADPTVSYGSEATSWMRIAPRKTVHRPSCKWEDVLYMFNDLIRCLGNEKRFLFYARKLEAMREGLFQIKYVLVDKNIGLKDVRYQESLVQKKLSKALGQSSQCLFTLLLYYLYGHVGDIELDICGGNCRTSKDKFAFCIGKIMTSDEQTMVQNGVKQLDRALRLFNFVWEVAGLKGALELQGHLWCIGAEDRTLTFRGNVFYVHGISL